MEQARGEALLDLARRRFDVNLRPIEHEVILHSCGYEDPSAWAGQAQERSPTGRPLLGWPGPVLRPALLRWLLTDREAVLLLEARGLRVWNAHLVKPLDLTSCRIPVRLELRYCLVEAPILLANADISSLYLRNCTLQQALHSSNLRLRGPLVLDDVTATDVIRFDASTIEGGAFVSNTVLNAEGIALSMQGAVVEHDLQLRPNFQSAGCVLLRGIQINGLLSLSGARLTTTGNALNIDNATIRWNAFLRDGFQSAGQIRMIATEIGGQLDCSGAVLTAEGIALSLGRAKIHGNVLLCSGFEASGKIEMVRTQIDGNLDFEASVIGPFTGENMIVGGDLFWRQITISDRTSLDLQGAKLTRLQDDEDSWPTKGKLKLIGSAIHDLCPLQNNLSHATARIAWLNLQPDLDLCAPQPWMHLTELFAAKGYEKAARQVRSAFRKHQSRIGLTDVAYDFFGYVWYALFARAGKRTLRTFCILLFSASLCIVLAGSITRFVNKNIHASQGNYPVDSHLRPTPHQSEISPVGPSRPLTDIPELPESPKVELELTPHKPSDNNSLLKLSVPKEDFPNVVNSLSKNAPKHRGKTSAKNMVQHHAKKVSPMPQH